jgi:hypothetical protein
MLVSLLGCILAVSPPPLAAGPPEVRLLFFGIPDWEPTIAEWQILCSQPLRAEGAPERTRQTTLERVRTRAGGVDAREGVCACMLASFLAVLGRVFPL